MAALLVSAADHSAAGMAGMMIPAGFRKNAVAVI
jgi:hypothetical protein